MKLSLATAVLILATAFSVSRVASANDSVADAAVAASPATTFPEALCIHDKGQYLAAWYDGKAKDGDAGIDPAPPWNPPQPDPLRTTHCTIEMWDKDPAAKISRRVILTLCESTWTKRTAVNNDYILAEVKASYILLSADGTPIGRWVSWSDFKRTDGKDAKPLENQAWTASHGSGTLADFYKAAPAWYRSRLDLISGFLADNPGEEIVKFPAEHGGFAAAASVLSYASSLWREPVSGFIMGEAFDKAAGLIAQKKLRWATGHEIGNEKILDNKNRDGYIKKGHAIWEARTSALDIKMTLQEAAEPYLKEKYAAEGYVGGDGTVKGGGLGCSAYATAVLYRMRYGKEWLDTYKTDWKARRRPHEWYGDQIAMYMGLGPAVVLPASAFNDAASVKKSKTKSGLYLFMARKDAEGHVGFVRIRDDGQAIQSHFSGLKAYQGLASGDFGVWHRESQYRGLPVSLYFIMP